MEDLSVALQAMAERPLSSDQILPGEVEPRAQPNHTHPGGNVPPVRLEQPVAVACLISDPLQQHRPFSHSGVYTPLPKARHPVQLMPFAGPSQTGVANTFGMFQDQMQAFLRERRERIARAELTCNVPPGTVPSESGIPVLERLSTRLPPLSTVLPTRSVQRTRACTSPSSVATTACFACNERTASSNGEGEVDSFF